MPKNPTTATHPAAHLLGCCLDAMDAAAPGEKVYALTFHLINAGGMTVAEAREQLSSPLTDARTANLLATWVLGSADLGEDYYAGKNTPDTHPDAELTYTGATASFPAGSYSNGL